jgi:hypothetical protein
MKHEVHAFKDSRGRWHRDIIGPLPVPAGARGVRESCHAESQIDSCPGFADQEAAVEDGRRRVKEIEGKAE